MAGQLDGYRRPNTPPEWVRDTDRRLNRQESGTDTVRIDAWVISVDDDGELVATKPGRRHVLTTNPDQTAT